MQNRPPAMQWSKRYALWRETLCDPRLVKHVNISRGSYRKSGDGACRFYQIAFDKEVVLRQDAQYDNCVAFLSFCRVTEGMTIDDMVTSDDPYIRGYACLDKRFGKSRIYERMIVEEVDFVRRCLKLKMSLYNFPEVKNGNARPDEEPARVDAD